MVADEAKLAIVYADFFGMRAPPVVADGSEADHCFHLFFSFFLVQAACLRHPWWRTEAKPNASYTSKHFGMSAPHVVAFAIVGGHC